MLSTGKKTIFNKIDSKPKVDILPVSYNPEIREVIIKQDDSTRRFSLREFVTYIGVCRGVMAKDFEYIRYSDIIERYFVEIDGIGSDCFKIKKDTILTKDFSTMLNIQDGLGIEIDNISNYKIADEEDCGKFKGYLRGVKYIILKHVLSILNESKDEHRKPSIVYKMSKMIRDEIGGKIGGIKNLKKEITEMKEIQSKLERRLDDIRTIVGQQAHIMSRYLEGSESSSS